MSSISEPTLDPGALRAHLGVLFMAAAAALTVLGVFEVRTEQCEANKDLSPHLLHCISRVKDTTVVLSLTGIAITTAAFTQAIQAVGTPNSTSFYERSEDPAFTLFHVYMTLALLTVISIVGSWALVHYQLHHLSIKQDLHPNRFWFSCFVTFHLKWTFMWWCHHIQLLTMDAFGVNTTLNYGKFPSLPKCTPQWMSGASARKTAKVIYIMLLVTIINNIMFGLPSFLLAVAGTNIYLAQADERPGACFPRPRQTPARSTEQLYFLGRGDGRRNQPAGYSVRGSTVLECEEVRLGLWEYLCGRARNCPFAGCDSERFSHSSPKYPPVKADGHAPVCFVWLGILLSLFIDLLSHNIGTSSLGGSSGRLRQVT
ncbi:hypothetical protein FS749_002348 [Ceratobasidium sp. UAMH 11750]|nr:hypothetical protein FS749_002348 [Ceratobasidium sp. UAMH 11750]